MKKIVFSPMLNFQGEPLTVDRNTKDGVDSVEVRMQDQLVNHCGLYQTQSGEENIQVFSIGQKIQTANGHVMLEESDFQLLKKVLQQPKAVCLVMASLHRAVEEAEDVNPNASAEAVQAAADDLTNALKELR